MWKTPLPRLAIGCLGVGVADVILVASAKEGGAFGCVKQVGEEMYRD